MPVLINQASKNRAEWLEARKSLVGGSDVPAILGMVPQRTATHVFLDKIGALEEQPDNDRMYWGRKLEATVAYEALDRLRAENPQDTWDILYPDALYRHPEIEFFGSTLDYILLRNGEPHNLECKTTGAHNAAVWEDGPADTAHVQAVAQQACCPDMKGSFVACLILQPSFKVYPVERSEALQAEIEKRVKEFWEYVRTKTPPPITAKTPDLAALLWPNGCGAEKVLPEKAVEIIDRYKTIGTEVDLLLKEKDALKAELQFMLADSPAATCGPWKLSWKDIVRKSYVVKDSHYRDFRISKRKEDA